LKPPCRAVFGLFTFAAPCFIHIKWGYDKVGRQQESFLNVTVYSHLLAGFHLTCVEKYEYTRADDGKNNTPGIDRLPERIIFYGKERGSVGTRTFLVFPSAKADFVYKGVKL